MLVEKSIEVDGNLCLVTVSDESRALQAAYAAGGAIVGIWRPDMPENPGLSLCLYLVTDPKEADEKLLEKAVRRRLGLPWRIAKTRRLLIREFCVDDPLEPAEEAYNGFFAAEEQRASEIFSDADKRSAYIKCQYLLCERGLWRLSERGTGEVIGKAGITGQELGYHIYRPYRNNGFAYEACTAILTYAKTELELDTVYLRTGRNNLPSIRLAEKLGFTPISSRRHEEADPQGFLCYEKTL